MYRLVAPMEVRFSKRMVGKPPPALFEPFCWFKLPKRSVFHHVSAVLNGHSPLSELRSLSKVHIRQPGDSNLTFFSNFHCESLQIYHQKNMPTGHETNKVTGMRLWTPFVYNHD